MSRDSLDIDHDHVAPVSVSRMPVTFVPPQHPAHINGQLEGTGYYYDSDVVSQGKWVVALVKLSQTILVDNSW